MEQEQEHAEFENPIQKAQRLRDITAKYRVLKFDPTCVRKNANVGTLKNGNFEKWYLEHPDQLIDPEFVKSMRYISPKLHKLLKTIAYLDAKDQREHGHMFKHFIFSDIKASTKLLAAGLVASGFRIGVKPVIAKSGKNIGKPIGINLLSEQELAQEKAMPGCLGHFDLMASGSVFSKAMTVPQKKQLFARFNARDAEGPYPRNNHGEQVRIIIMDNGFKEGVDLFDVKYVHIFEPQVTMADSKQVIGRGTRTCGQKGLTFDPERGWPLHVYVYDLDFGTSKSGFLEAGSAFDLYLKALNIDLRLFKLHDEFEKLIMEGSVDYELNKAVHEFRGKADKEPNYSWSRSASAEVPFKLLESSDDVESSYTTIDSSSSNNKSNNSYNSNKSSNSNKSNDSEDDDSEDEDKYMNGKVTLYLKVINSDDDSSNIRSWLMNHINIIANDMYVQDQGDRKFTLYYKTKKAEVPAVDEMERLVNHFNSFGIYTFVILDMEYVSKLYWGGKDIDNQLSEDIDNQLIKVASSDMKGGAINKINFTPTQGFVSNYFTPQNPIKGMLLNHSVGTGKTCTAIATATNTFEPQGYTILWVTRTTLRNDIWKNMFDMVCHHGLMNRASMPTSQTERMKLLSKSWSIKPISYKQFTNLVTKANSYYARLVKKNGAVDPLRKTLLVIDEAHKLFSDNDLSSIERPDTAKLHQALMNSYIISGDDSVRLLLMTATPITKDPLELVKLLNLCKMPDEQIPDTLGEFANKYLKQDGTFSEAGRRKFLDDIAGHISYLNREKDARQFSQPVLHHVSVPFNDKKMIRAFDKNLLSRTHDAETNKLKTDIAQRAYELEKHFKGFDMFMVPIKNVCDDIDNPALYKKCMTAVNKKRAEIVKEVKALAKTKRSQINDIKQLVKKFTKSKKNKMVDVRNEMKQQQDLYNDVYKKSAYAKLASCGKVDTVNVTFEKAIAEKPDVQEVDGQITHWKTVVPADIIALNARIKAEKKILDKPKLKSLRNELMYKKRIHKLTAKNNIKSLKKDRKGLVKTHKKEFMAEKKAANKEERIFKKDQAKMKKLARKEGEVQEVINKDINDIIDKYMHDLHDDENIKMIITMDNAKKKQVKEAKAQVKKANKTRKNKSSNSSSSSSENE